VEDPAHTFPCNACYRGEIALGDLLPNKDAALADVTAERLGEWVSQRGGNGGAIYRSAGAGRRLVR